MEPRSGGTTTAWTSAANKSGVITVDKIEFLERLKLVEEFTKAMGLPHNIPRVGNKKIFLGKLHSLWEEAGEGLLAKINAVDNSDATAGKIEKLDWYIDLQYYCFQTIATFDDQHIKYEEDFFDYTGMGSLLYFVQRAISSSYKSPKRLTRNMSQLISIIEQLGYDNDFHMANAFRLVHEDNMTKTTGEIDPVTGKKKKPVGWVSTLDLSGCV